MVFFFATVSANRDLPPKQSYVVQALKIRNETVFGMAFYFSNHSNEKSYTTSQNGKCLRQSKSASNEKSYTTSQNGKCLRQSKRADRLGCT
jgi:hypothetical protein